MESHYCTYCMSPVEPGKPCPVCGLTEGAYKPLPHHLLPGTILLGRYLIGRVLGRAASASPILAMIFAWSFEWPSRSFSPQIR